MVICFSCAATGPTSPAPIAPASASAIVQRALISIPPFAFSAFCLLGFSGRRRRPHVGEAIFWKKLSFWNIHCQVGGHCQAHERRPARACAARRTNRPFVPCTLDLVAGIKELFKVGAPIRHRSFMSTRPSYAAGDCLPRQSACSSSLMLLLVAQQSSLLVPYLEAVPVGYVMSSAPAGRRPHVVLPLPGNSIL